MPPNKSNTFKVSLTDWKQPDTQTASPELRPLNGKGFTFHRSGHSPIRRQTPALPGTSKSAFFQCAHDWMCFCPSSGSYIVQCELSRQGCKEIWRGSIPCLAWAPVSSFFLFFFLTDKKSHFSTGQDAVLAEVPFLQQEFYLEAQKLSSSHSSSNFFDCCCCFFPSPPFPFDKDPTVKSLT